MGWWECSWRRQDVSWDLVNDKLLSVYKRWSGRRGKRRTVWRETTPWCSVGRERMAVWLEHRTWERVYYMSRRNNQTQGHASLISNGKEFGFIQSQAKLSVYQILHHLLHLGKYNHPDKKEKQKWILVFENCLIHFDPIRTTDAAIKMQFYWSPTSAIELGLEGCECPCSRIKTFLIFLR